VTDTLGIEKERCLTYLLIPKKKERKDLRSPPTRRWGGEKKRKENKMKDIELAFKTRKKRGERSSLASFFYKRERKRLEPIPIGGKFLTFREKGEGGRNSERLSSRREGGRPSFYSCCLSSERGGVPSSSPRSDRLRRNGEEVDRRCW